METTPRQQCGVCGKEEAEEKKNAGKIQNRSRMQSRARSGHEKGGLFFSVVGYFFFFLFFFFNSP